MSAEPMAIEASCQRAGWQMRQAWLNHDVYRLRHRQMIRDTHTRPDKGHARVGQRELAPLSSAAGPAFTQAYSALQHRLSLTARACQLTTTTEYPNSLTLRGLPQHRLNIKLGAPVMLLRAQRLATATTQATSSRHKMRRYITAGTALHAVNIQAISYYYLSHSYSI